MSTTKVNEPERDPVPLPVAQICKFPIWSRQPFKALYIAFRASCLVLLVPSWFLLYLPPSNRPRSTWTINQSVLVRLIRWMMPLNAICGLSPMTTDKSREVTEGELKETSFVWIEPIAADLLKGKAKDERVGGVKVPGYVWPKGDHLAENGNDDGQTPETVLVGLFFHGGGYMMGHGGEDFPECDIARQIFKKTKIKRILSVDYRLASEACHPGQLVDALAGYAYLVQKLKINADRIIVIGACAGGHLALMLLRYLADEKVLPMPRGMMLFSPWVDMVIDKEIEDGTTPPRSNADIDLLGASFLANLRFLGHQPTESFSDPLLSANRSPPNSFSIYPRTFISAGSCEAFHRECQQLADIMKKDGVDVTFDVQPDAVHDFLGFGSGVPCDDARMAVMTSVVGWIDELVQ